LPGAIKAALLRRSAFGEKRGGALANSPPAEKPCNSRASTMMSGAPTPIAAYVGANAIIAIAIVIKAMTSSSAALRPRRSA